MIVLLSIFFSFLILVLTLRKSGGLSPQFLHVFYCFGCIVVIALVWFFDLEKDDLLFTAMPMPDFTPVINEVLVIYSLLCFFGYLTGVKKKKHIMNDQRQFFDAMFLKMKHTANRQSVKAVLILSVFVFLLTNMIHFLAIDKSVLLSNTFYLSIKEADQIGLESAVGKIYHILFRYVGLLFALLFFLAISLRLHLYGVVFLLAALYPFLFLLAGDSRWAGLYFFCGIIVFVSKRQPISVLVSALLMILTIIKVLIGRESGHHGILHIFDFLFVDNVLNFTEVIAGLSVNIFEGAMNLANTLLHDPDFASSYKNLSFSPLFSFIDGFAAIRDTLKYKWAPNVPMSAISESYQFGWSYFLFFCLAYFYIMRRLGKFFANNLNIKVLGLFIIFVYIAFGVHTYSIRTFWKIMVGLIIILSMPKLFRVSK